jgi:hypothetical protein
MPTLTPALDRIVDFPNDLRAAQSLLACWKVCRSQANPRLNFGYDSSGRQS